MRDVISRAISVSMLCLVASACGHADAQHATPPVASSNAPTPPAHPSRDPAQPTATGDSSSAAVNVPSIGCPAPTCAFHAGAGAYFTCLSGGAGTCFHFGAACAPADACMYDPGDRQYKTCAKPSEGVCSQWGAACAPSSKCMFDPADSLHHQCDEIVGGACKRFGALCAP